MPNYCNNALRLYHEDPAQIDRALEALKRGDFFQTFVPMPEELDIIAGVAGPDESPEQKELVRRSAENLERFGYRNWYEWRIANWGTKWDVDDLDVLRTSPTMLSSAFESAWSPPTAFYDQLMEQGFKIDATYLEEGMGFVGEYIDGEDQCYEFQTIEDIRKLPRHLRELINEESYEEEAHENE